MATSTIDRWFTQEVQVWRSGAAVTWTLMLIPPTMFTFVSIANIDLWHPLVWIAGSICQAFVPSSWIYVLLVTVAFSIMTIANLKHFTVLPVVHSTRWSTIWNVIHPRRLLLITTSGALCGWCAWCYLRLVVGPYSKLSLPCQEDSSRRCLNEGHVFVVVHGAMVGMLYTACFFIYRYNYLTFPLIQQTKFFQIKSNTVGLLWRAAGTSLWRLRFYYVIYYLVLGQVVKDTIFHNVGLLESTEQLPVNTLRGLLNVSLLWHVWLSGTLLSFLLSLSTHICRVYNTEPFEFPVQSVMEQHQNVCLPNALAAKPLVAAQTDTPVPGPPVRQSSILEYLAYYDLYLLSKHSPQRRQQVFSLTHLGGHPQNWMAIHKACLQALQNFSDDISGYNLQLMATGPLRNLSGDRPLTDRTKGCPNQDITGRSQSEDATQSLKYRGTQPSKQDIATQQEQMKKRSISTMLGESLKKTKALGFFFAEHPDSQSRKLLAQSQKYIWAVEALSHLVCASFLEDTYGVVQKTLPEIISSLLTLQEAVEKHFKLVANTYRKPSKDSAGGQDLALHFALKSSLKSAIYRIVATFDSHIRSIPMNTELMRRLSLFLEYRE